MGDRHRETWPGWAEPLRPDGDRRRRLREAISLEAREELARRERRAVVNVASGWTGRILPLAAAVALAFGWAAVRGVDPAPTRAPISAERLVDPDSATALPRILVNRSEPSTDRVLQSVVYDP